MENSSVYQNRGNENLIFKGSSYNKVKRDREQLYNNILELIRPLKFDRVLDIDCGKASLLSAVAEHKTEVEVYGIESDQDKIKAGSRRLKERGRLMHCDSEIIPWEEDYFSLLMSVNKFKNYSHPEKVLAEIKRVLKPGGYLVLADSWRMAPVRVAINFIAKAKKDNVKLYSQTKLKGLLEQDGFKVNEWRIINNSSYILLAELAK